MRPALCRAARALLNMSQADLAGAAVVPLAVIADYETGVRKPNTLDLDAIQDALERAGVEFLDGSHPGVRMLKVRR
jgi:transcriptional regulator with XRE-family HTH domain